MFLGMQFNVLCPDRWRLVFLISTTYQSFSILLAASSNEGLWDGQGAFFIMIKGRTIQDSQKLKAVMIVRMERTQIVVPFRMSPRRGRLQRGVLMMASHDSAVCEMALEVFPLLWGHCSYRLLLGPFPYVVHV
jgi:hypothetical protein